MKIEIATKATEELVEALHNLIPQLTVTPHNISLRSVEEILNREGTSLFIARNVNNEIVGTLTLVIYSIPSCKKAFIEDVVVDQSSLGKGLGKRLVEAAIERARAEGVEKIELSSNPKRVAANALYRKIGFQIRLTNFYRLNLNKEK